MAAPRPAKAGDALSVGSGVVRGSARTVGRLGSPASVMDIPSAGCGVVRDPAGVDAVGDCAGGGLGGPTAWSVVGDCAGGLEDPGTGRMAAGDPGAACEIGGPAGAGRAAESVAG
jgi:hypothetical protein